MHELPWNDGTSHKSMLVAVLLATALTIWHFVACGHAASLESLGISIPSHWELFLFRSATPTCASFRPKVPRHEG